ncbi:MAG: GEVED domain-containing protein [Bacteroidales bacterium]|nr:GEVED domain-containing protein [Bacteroidales bacterium]
MKHILLTLSALVVALGAAAAQPMVKPAPRGASPSGFMQKRAESAQILKSTPKDDVTVDDLLADPEGTVFSGPFNSETANWTGFQNSDQGRPEMPTKFYQYYNGCAKSINAVRVIGMFNYWDDVEYDWIYCGDRPGYDENYTMTTPVNFEISFYRVDDEGMPGECVFTKVMPLTGRFTGVIDGVEGNSGPLMEFIAELGEDVKLETGYFSFSAVAEEGVVPTCWFSIFTSDSSFGWGFTHMGDYGFIGATPCVFSLIGSGEYAAEKALKVNDITSPSSLSCGRMEQVVVPISNIGTADVNDVALQLEVDGEVIATEYPGFTLPAFTTRNYVFANRIDLSAPGEHTVKVINITPGDEGISLKSATVFTTTLEPGEIASSEGKYSWPEDVLTHVTIGDIDNESEANELGYEDFTNLSTDITVGQTLTLTATLNPEGNGGIIGAWVDWNCDGRFDGQGEAMGYTRGEPIDVAIPAGASITPGPKRLRVIGSTSTYSLFEPHGEYYYGQTEDYTLNVVAPENSPAARFSTDILISDADEETSTLEIALSNEGVVNLTGDINITYELPAIYENRQITQAPANVTVKRAALKARTNDAPSKINIAHTLKYDNGIDEAISVSNVEFAIFGQTYSSEYMTALKGMNISCIDAYISDPTASGAAQIYEENDGTFTLVAEQAFTPEANAWNRIVFDTPYVISGKSIIYAVKLVGLVEGKFHIGVDAGPAVAGYGDLCNIGGDTWWSMAALGINSNYCVRANVSGTPNAEISWLKLDNYQFDIEPDGSATFKATLDRSNVLDGTYEGHIVFNTNDPLCPTKAVDVYMLKSLKVGIDAAKAHNAAAKIEGSDLVVTSDKAISSLRVISTTGLALGNCCAAGNRAAVAIDTCPAGIYVVEIRYIDGTKECIKMSIAR